MISLHFVLFTIVKGALYRCTLLFTLWCMMSVLKCAVYCRAFLNMTSQNWLWTNIRQFMLHFMAPGQRGGDKK